MPAVPAALVQSWCAAGRMRRSEMIKVVCDKRRGDETQPLKGNYFCSCLLGSFFDLSLFQTCIFLCCCCCFFPKKNHP